MGILNEEQQSEDVVSKVFYEQKFKQYEIFVSSTDKISSNRMDANKFFMTINSFILTAYSIFFDKLTLAIWIIPVLGIIMSIAWVRTLKSYSTLNSAKFEVINRMEEELPLQPYKDEWDILKNDCEYKTLSKTEQKVPYAFGIVFFVLLIIHMHSLLIK